jgi:16S rRNA (cytosine967-C5)-methyltransferase
MRAGGRYQAAIEVLVDVLTRHTPVNDALRDWGKSHRFAGSKDRAFIGNLVHDGLRKKSSIGWQMDDDSPRALVLGTLLFEHKLPLAEIDTAFTETHGPGALTAAEKTRAAKPIALTDAPEWVQADVPDWVWPAFADNFGEEAVAEGQALTASAPLDLRVNRIKMERDTALATLAPQKAKPTLISPHALRIERDGPSSRLPNVQIEPIYQEGGVEIQDEGSQVIAALVNAKDGDKILDFCAGGGGKSLAIASDTQDAAKITAFDIDKRRLAPLYQRKLRAGYENIDVVQPPLSNLSKRKGQFDKVVLDAPCTGVGTWRRKPDSKWRLSEKSLEVRLKEQEAVLETGCEFVRNGGLLFYMTCSMLAEENEGQVYAFLERHKEFTLLSAGEVWEELFGVEAPKPWSSDGCSLTLTPASTGTDGFFFAVMEKSADGKPPKEDPSKAAYAPENS